MTRSTHQSPTKNRPTTQLQFERLPDRLLMAGEVIWENNSPPAGVSLNVVDGALEFEGSGTRDKVLVHDIVAKKAHKQLVTGSHYIEVQHQDASNRLRRAWVKQDKNHAVAMPLVFHGNAGNDHFQYFDSTGDPAPRRDRRILADGGTGNDSLHGYNQCDILFGNEGDDDLFGELGNDLLVGGTGNDRLWGDGVTNANRSQTTDVDYLEGGEGADELYGWQGGDTLNGGTYWMIHDNAIDKLYGGSEADRFYFEIFFDPRTEEPNDFSIPQGDRSDVFEVLPPPPSYDNWLDANEKVSAPLPMNKGVYPNQLDFFAHGDGPILSTPTRARADGIDQSRGLGEPISYSSAAGSNLLANPDLEIGVVTGKKKPASAFDYSLSPVLAVRR